MLSTEEGLEMVISDILLYFTNIEHSFSIVVMHSSIDTLLTNAWILYTPLVQLAAMVFPTAPQGKGRNVTCHHLLSAGSTHFYFPKPRMRAYSKT